MMKIATSIDTNLIQNLGGAPICNVADIETVFSHFLFLTSRRGYSGGSDLIVDESQTYLKQR